MASNHVTRSIQPERLAAWIWTTGDVGTLEGFDRLIRAKLTELGANLDGVSYPSTIKAPGSFSGEAIRAWIESVHTPDHTQILQRILATIAKRFGRGDVVSGHSPVTRIEVVRRANSGLYGVVWEGRQVDLGRKVAVKIINPSMVHAADALAHARALARVDAHPNIVTVYAVERVSCPGLEAPVDALIMEWLEGKTLGDRLSSRHFSVDEARSISAQILDGLEHMHTSGVAHGDLHPGNVILTESAAKIIDINAAGEFSLAHLTSNSRQSLQQADIESARYLVWRVISHSDAPLSLVSQIEPKLRVASSLSEIRRHIAGLTARSETLVVSPISPPGGKVDDELIQRAARSANLSPLALEILLAAASANGNIIKGEADSGFYILVPGARNFASENSRIQAALREAMRQLIMSRYVDDIDSKLCNVNVRGYDLCDTLSK